MTTAYPLTWPTNFPRTPEARREKGRFTTTLSSALSNVQDSLRKFASDSGKALQHLVISSNYSLGVSNPRDPGVAVYFLWDGLQVCIPVDRYQRIEFNLQAIHHVIEARRVELRHGTLALVRATFTGFAALAAPSTTRPWQAVLGVEPGCSLDAAETSYRMRANVAHPDRGGTQDAMAELNVAIEQARKELKP